MSRNLFIFLSILLTFPALAQSLNIFSIGNGQMQVRGVGFIGSARLYQVNFIKDGRRFYTTGTSESGSFNYTTPRAKFRNGEILVVKVVNYNGHGRDYVRRAVYRGSDRE